MEDPPMVLKAQSGFPSTSTSPPTAVYGDSGLSAPLGKPRRIPARLLFCLLPKGLQPLSPASPSRPSPHSLANLRLGIRSSFAVQSRRRNAAHKPFPRSPRHGVLPVCGSQEAGRGEAPRCHGDGLRAGEGPCDDNDRFETALGLAPLLG